VRSVDWRERYERAAARYAEGERRELDERQLVQLANSAWAAGLSLLMAGDDEGASEWLARSAARYQESWDAGAATEAWGRPIGAMKALLIAGEDASEVAQWTLETCLGVRQLDMSVSPIGRYAAAMALLILGRDEEAVEVAETLDEDFPADVAAAVAAIGRHEAASYAGVAERVRRSFEERDAYLEDVPVADTYLALEALALLRRLES
jgi:hypothetical protein